MSEVSRARPFAGFPDGRLRATVVPSLFFSEVLGSIDDLVELKLALYLLWRLGDKKVYPRYITRREIAADSVARGGLVGVDDDALGDALARVVRRGVVLRRTVEQAGETDEWYFLNSTSGRRAVEDLEAGRLDLSQTVLPEEPTRVNQRSSIFELYEQNVGLLTPLIVDDLREAERRFPGDWIEDAFRQAVIYNRRSWRYIQRILERWSTDGKDDEASGRRAAPSHYPSAPRRARRD